MFEPELPLIGGTGTKPDDQPRRKEIAKLMVINRALVWPNLRYIIRDMHGRCRVLVPRNPGRHYIVLFDLSRKPRIGIELEHHDFRTILRWIDTYDVL